MNALDVLEFFESASMADATRALKYASRIVAARTATAPMPGTRGTNSGREPRRNRNNGAPSIRTMTESVLRERMEPMGSSEILEAIHAQYNRSVGAESLTSILSRLVSKRDTFSRRAKGMYALIEWESGTELPLDQGDSPAQE